MILQTKRLILRETTWGDWHDLCGILQDGLCMYAYEHAFSDWEVDHWLTRTLARYRADGFGLWTVLERDTGRFAGHAGITMQDWDGRRTPEVGYLFRRDMWNRGYATEAALGCLDYGFSVLGLAGLCSIIRENNLPSRRVAEHNGLRVAGRLCKHYQGMELPHVVYAVTREEFQRRRAGEG